MRLLLTLILCFAWTTSKTQTVDSRVGLQTIYMPQFKVQEAYDSNVQTLGIRWMFSYYDFAPLEFGFHAYPGFSDVSRVTVGINLAYPFVELQNHDFKIGLGLSKIDLEDVEASKNELGPHIGDVEFTEWGSEFKPYIEWE